MLHVPAHTENPQLQFCTSVHTRKTINPDCTRARTHGKLSTLSLDEPAGTEKLGGKSIRSCISHTAQLRKRLTHAQQEIALQQVHHMLCQIFQEISAPSPRQGSSYKSLDLEHFFARHVLLPESYPRAEAGHVKIRHAKTRGKLVDTFGGVSLYCILSVGSALGAPSI